MSSVKRATLRGRIGMFAPHFEDVPELSDLTLRAPQREYWGLDLVSSFLIGLIHLEVDLSGRAEILAGRMNGLWSTEASSVLLESFCREGSGRSVLHCKMLVEEEIRICSDHMFRQGSLLDKKEPPHIFGGKFLRRVSIHPQSRHNLQKSDFADCHRVI